MNRFLFFLLIFIGIGLGSCDDSTKASLIRAGIMSEEIVKEKMRFPSEVEFGDEIKGEVFNPSTFKVLRKFTAKNAFGVKSDYAYRIFMTHKGGDWAELSNWNFENLTIEEVSTGKQYFYDLKEHEPNQDVVDSLKKVITG